MNIGVFTKPNEKGQIVIPKDMREKLGIDKNATLNLTLSGRGIYIVPVDEFITKRDTESSYKNLLEKTKGTWADEDVETLEKKRRKIELQATKQAKKPW